MNRKYRLTRTTDFKRVRRMGRSYAHPLAILVAVRNDLEVSRFGVSVGKSLGGAAVRNRVKRRMREALRLLLASSAPGWDAILVARPPIVGADWSQLQETMAGLLQQAGILREQA